MSLPDKCPTCLRADRSSPASIRQQLERDVETWQAEATRLAARVAELEARVRDAEESNANAQAHLSAAEATVELKHAENQAARSHLWLTETACDALKKRLAELERDLEQAKADRARAAMDARNPLLAQLAEMEARCQEYFNLVKDVASNLDHDTDAHRYGYRCIVCDAEAMVRNATDEEAKQ